MEPEAEEAAAEVAVDVAVADQEANPAASKEVRHTKPFSSDSRRQSQNKTVN